MSTAACRAAKSPDAWRWPATSSQAASSRLPDRSRPAGPRPGANEKRAWMPRRRNAGNVAAPHNCARPSSIRRLAAPAGTPSTGEQVAWNPGVAAKSTNSASSNSRGYDSSPGALPSGVPKPSRATCIHVRHSSCGSAVMVMPSASGDAVVSRDRAAKHVLEPGNAIAMRGQHRRHGRIGQDRQLEAHGLASIGPGLLDCIEPRLSIVVAKTDADGLVGWRACAGKNRVSAGKGRHQHARARRARRNGLGNRHRQAHLGAIDASGEGVGSEHA